MEDHDYMGLALEEAARASECGEVPVGAVLIRDGLVLARGHNRTEGDHDPTSHAEMAVIRAAAGDAGGWRLDGSTLYVTLEPCTMCIGAIILARIERLVFGCRDPKSGAVGSLFDISAESRLNHRVEVLSGVRSDECGALLKDFFKELRASRKEGGLLRGQP